MKILLVATRKFDGPQTGRKLVLRTIMRSCAALGHQLEVVVVGAHVGEDRFMGVPGPSMARICANVLRHFLFGHKSLNECLYWSDSAQRTIAGLVRNGSFEVVIADMVRTAQFCANLHVPWVLDLDDLLSDRYAALADAQDSRRLLGYFSERIPPYLRHPATWLSRRLLRVEAARMEAQEKRFGMLADAVTLVSPVEARRLGQRLGRMVHDTAMGVDVAEQLIAESREHEGNAVLFIGGLDYQPNLDAVNHYVRSIAPELVALGCNVALHVVGNAPAALRPVDHNGDVVYLGYVDDLSATIRRYTIFAAPIVAEGGVKTKVLEAMAHGLVVIGTEQAVTGLSVTAGRDCIVATTPTDFAVAIQRLKADAGACARIGHAASSFVRTNFSHATISGKWKVLLADAVDHFQQRNIEQVSASWRPAADSSSDDGPKPPKSEC